MIDRLPGITLKVNVPPPVFLQRIAQIARQTGEFEVGEDEGDEEEGYTFVTLKPTHEARHEGLVGQIIAGVSDPSRVLIEIRAQRWQPHPPTYDVYVRAARNIFTPLLRLYDEEYGAASRLDIQSKADLEPDIPQKAQELFEKFALLADKNALHPNDWERYYKFIQFCSTYDVPLTQVDIRDLLIASGFSLEDADRISETYYHGRNLLDARY